MDYKFLNNVLINLLLLVDIVNCREGLNGDL